MKACPGLRSGIDRCGSLSFAIRDIPSSIRPPIRHSGEDRNPEGLGRGETTRRWTKPPGAVPFSSSYCGLRKATVIPAGSFRREHVRTPIRGRNPGDTRAPPTHHQHTHPHTAILRSAATTCVLMGVRLQTAFSIRDLPPQSRQSLAEATKRLIPWIAPL